MLLVLGQLKQFDFILSALFIGLNFTDTDQHICCIHNNAYMIMTDLVNVT